MSEIDFMRVCQVEASKLGARLFRNNTAVAWVGNLFRSPRPVQVIIQPGDVLLRRARPLHAGLCVGSSDLIGWQTITIRPEHVGTQVAVFIAAENKTTTGVASKEQIQFVSAVNAAGGRAAIVRTIPELKTILTR